MSRQRESMGSLLQLSRESRGQGLPKELFGNWVVAMLCVLCVFTARRVELGWVGWLAGLLASFASGVAAAEPWPRAPACF